MSAPAPLVVPLAGLLAEPPGTERRFDIHGVTIPLPDRAMRDAIAAEEGVTASL